MAPDDDDDVMEPDEFAADEELEATDDDPDADPDVEPEELDEESLEDDFDEIDGGFAGDDEAELPDTDDEEEDETEAARARRTTTGEEDDDDEDLLAPDDVEADLDTILKDRLVAADEAQEDEEEETDDRVDSADRLQPKRADEQLCPSCFLLVRQSAPSCPVADDECPLFS